MEFGLIRDIPHLHGVSQHVVHMTFDIDWAGDDVLLFLVRFLERHKIPATFFVTHRTEVLDEIQSCLNAELGIHPNFNFLLEGDFRYGKNYEEVLEYYLRLVPDAVSFRSHSLVQSTKISNAASKMGLKYECNSYIPVTDGVHLAPWLHWDKKMYKIPHIWEDDLEVAAQSDWDGKNLLNSNGLKVLAFHPVHIFLNTADLAYYNQVKDDANKIGTRDNLQNGKYGVFDFFTDIVRLVRE